MEKTFTLAQLAFPSQKAQCFQMLEANFLPRRFIFAAVMMASIGVGAGALAQEQEQAEEGTAAEEGSGEDDDNKGGGSFLPLPIFITEPAIGEGLGIGLVYFHEPPDPNLALISTPSELGKTGKRPNPPPTATGVFAFKTSNGTQGFGVGHSGSYLDDKIRVVGALASMEIKTTFYQNDIPFHFSIDGEAAYLSFKRKLGSSRWFFGVSTSYIDGLVDFDLSDPITPAKLKFRHVPPNGRPGTAQRASAFTIARHTRSGVAGMSSRATPISPSASTIALMTAGGAPVAPLSPAPFTPRTLTGLGAS